MGDGPWGQGGVTGGWWDRGCGGGAGMPPSTPAVCSRMEGYGSYTLPTGAEYRGSLWDGMFHGKGEMQLCRGGGYRALWDRGVATQVRPWGAHPEGAPLQRPRAGVWSGTRGFPSRARV